MAYLRSRRSNGDLTVVKSLLLFSEMDSSEQIKALPQALSKAPKNPGLFVNHSSKMWDDKQHGIHVTR